MCHKETSLKPSAPRTAHRQWPKHKLPQVFQLSAAAILTEYMPERLLKSSWPALTLFLTPRMVPFLLQMLTRLLLKTVALLALAYRSRSSGSQPLASAASTARPFRWLLASLPCSAPGLLVPSESTEPDGEPHRDASSLNTSAKTRPLLADATLNRTVLPAFCFSRFPSGPSIERQERLTCFTGHSEKPDALVQRAIVVCTRHQHG